MSDLFAEYDLLARSGLFDPAFYVSCYPAATHGNQDPLMHYVECGGRERLNPSAGFDTAHYLKQCEAFGEAPPNPLYHYLTVGITRGMTPSPDANLLSLDVPKLRDGRVAVWSQRGLSIIGWAIAAQGVESVDIAIDGKQLARAYHGLRRPDVATAHPARKGALCSGFAAHLPPKALPSGEHQVSVSMLSRGGQLSRVQFAVTVDDLQIVSGPSMLRRKMPQAEVDLKLDLLRQLGAQPDFRVVMSARAADGGSVAERTLRTLRRQTYTHWRLESAPGGRSRSAPAGRRTFYLFLAAGDELGCDALLEFALASALEPDITLWYSDDRRAGMDGRVDAFFKPGWSPDLLLSFNYIGRAWCVEASAVRGRLRDLAAVGDYERVLRVSEACGRIGHLPKVLQQQCEHSTGNPASEQSALVEALKRRDIHAEVLSGGSRTGFRVRREVQSPKVSIIIPTCAAGGLVKECLESLRQITAYKSFEVICIENIPRKERRWRDWLTERADVLISTQEPFNWARFNNLAVTHASGELLLFLNDDTRIIESEWLRALVEHAQRPEVATVGALLLYPDRSVQHGGFVLDHTGRGRHAFRHLAEDDAGYFGLAHCTRNVIGSTGACLMTRRDVFTRLGGFDEDHAVINNDLDYCLRAAEQGLLNVYTPYARLIHHELASRASTAESYDTAKFHRRWRGVAAVGDPYFNPNLSREQDQLVVDCEPLETVVAGHPRFTRSSIKRILVVKVDHIGDCVNALPAVRRLRRYFPAAHLSVLAGRGTEPVWRAEPAVDDFIAFDFFHARSGKGQRPMSAEELAAMEQRLRSMDLDLAIDLRKQPDTRDVLKMTGAEVLIGFDSQGRFPWLDVALEWDEDVPLRVKHGHVADDLVALVEAVGAHSEQSRLAARESPAVPVSLPQDLQRKLFALPLVCVHPAAGSVMRQWPVERFAALVELLLDLGDCNVALIGGADERSLAQEVLAGVSRRRQVFNLTGRLPLAQLPGLLARTALFVGNNSGPQHLAAAAGIPTVGIHSGVVDAREWGPLGLRAVAIRKDVACSPCFLEFPEQCQRRLVCLTELPVGYVYRACLRALGRSPDRRHQNA